jgi:competence protein ComEC
MNIHDKFFWSFLFFLLGVVLETIFTGSFYLVLSFVLLASLYFFLSRKIIFAFLVLVAVLGAVYTSVFSYLQLKNINIPFGKNENFSGIVKEAKTAGNYQELEISLTGQNSGLVSVRTNLYPEFEYGDLISLKGIINRPQDEFKEYFLSRGIFGEINFPGIKLLDKNKGNFLKAGLIVFRQKIVNIFKENLPKEKAAFLTGITIGGKEDFSKEFKEKMSLSGTTHLVALSGYNISVIAWAAGLLFASFFSGTVSFYLSVLTIVLFVIMAGAEASIVRAAIMGVIVLLSGQAERLFSSRNAIVLAAFIMALFNPGVLIFNVGFQLSFAALLGIVYLAPALKDLFKIQTGGFLSWKENAITTVAAQIMAMPVLLYSFGSFSFASLFANILILGFIPATMAIGFIMAAVGLISLAGQASFLAKILGELANIMISYEFFIINIFSRFSLSFKLEKLSFGFWAVYYLLIFAFIIYRRKNESRT